MVKLNDVEYSIRKNGEVDYFGGVNEYNSQGLILHLDGINNTRTGHNQNATIWEDLSGNNNDFKLSNFDNTNNSGWKEESLLFDGENDYLNSLQNFDFKNANVLTIQFVDLNGTLYTNNELVAILESSTNYGTMYNSFLVDFNEDWAIKKIASNYNIGNVGFNIRSDSESVIQNESISYTITFNAKQEYNNYVQMYKNAMIRELYIPSDNKVNLSNFTFKTYPMYIGSRAGKRLFAKMRLASVRVYDRVLTEEEIKYNYEIDRVRFNMD